MLNGQQKIQVVCGVQIAKLPDGNVQVGWTGGDETMVLGMLEQAKFVIHQKMNEKPSNIIPPPPEMASANLRG